MSRTITLDCDGNDITCMKVFDALKYPCSACDNKDCPDRETYEDIKEDFGFEYYTEDYTCQNKAIDLSFKCSKCNSFVECNDYWGSAYICDGDWNFCPNCGRKVVD